LLRKQLNELRVTSVYNRSLIEASLDPLLVLRTDGKIADVNAATEKATGYTRTELISTEFSKYFTEPEQTQAAYQKVFQRGSIRNHPLKLQHRDGHVTLVLYNASMYQDEYGQVVGVFAAARDITDRMKAEETLKESEKKYRLLADHVHDVIFALDMNLNYTYVSPSIKILRGYEPDEVLKQQSFETLTPASRDLAMRSLSEIMDLEKSEHRDINISQTLEMEMIRKDGSTVWTEVKFSFIRDENQRMVGILGVTRDISERKRAEVELKQSEERYRNIFENAQGGIFQATYEGQYLAANLALATMLGYDSPEDLMTTVIDITTQLYVNPEVRKT
jgi:PAS domain S-box-containing protein